MLSPSNSTQVVYAIGDSLIGDETNPCSPLFHLQGMLTNGAVCKARGVGAEMSWYTRMRLERDVIECDPKPDTCIVLAGVNDLQQDVPGVVINANLEAMYLMLLQAGVRPIALTIYPFGEHMSWTSEREASRQEVRAWMHTVLPVSMPEVEVVDVEDVIGDLSDKARPRIRADYALDLGIHTNAAGAGAVARALVERSSLGAEG